MIEALTHLYKLKQAISGIRERHWVSFSKAELAKLNNAMDKAHLFLMTEGYPLQKGAKKRLMVAGLYPKTAEELDRAALWTEAANFLGKAHPNATVAQVDALVDLLQTKFNITRKLEKKQ